MSLRDLLTHPATWCIGVPVAALIGLVLALHSDHQQLERKHEAWQKWCQSQGRAEPDCELEWDRVHRPSDSAPIMVPVYMPMGR